MSIKKIFIPEAEIEISVVGRLGEVFYWIGSIFGLAALYYGIFERDPEIFGSCMIMFFLGRALMYILSGR